MPFVPTLRPSEEDFLNAIAELGQVTSVLAERFNAHPDTVRQWYEYFGLDAPYKYVLTESDIPLVRALQGSLTATEVGVKFEVAARTVRDVWNGKTWGWV